MKMFKIVVCFMLILIVSFSVFSSVNAGMLDDIISKGNSFFKPGTGTDQNNLGTNVKTYIETDIKPMINTLGIFIFLVVGVLLGVKYVWSGVEGKSQSKEGLITYLVAVVLFFSANAIYGLITGTITQTISNQTNFAGMEGSLWETIISVANFMAIIGVIALGIKYMVAPAGTKADIKKDMVPVLIGLVLIFSIVNILNIVINTSTQIIK